MILLLWYYKILNVTLKVIIFLCHNQSYSVILKKKEAVCKIDVAQQSFQHYFIIH